MGKRARAKKRDRLLAARLSELGRLTAAARQEAAGAAARGAALEIMAAAAPLSVTPEPMPEIPHPAAAFLRLMLTPFVPPGWRLREPQPCDGVRLFAGDLSVIVTGAVEADGREWAHLSVAGPGRVPTWAELVSVRDAIFGGAAYAVKVVPPSAEHVNIHPDVLHLWLPNGFRPLPDFTRGTGSI